MADTKQYLLMAYTMAKKSPDLSTQNGAVIITPSGVAGGYNKFPTRVSVTKDRLQRPLKYSYMEHAERSAIYKAATLQLPVLGSTMYSPWFACADCGRAIIEVGIRKVVGHKKMLDETPDRWKESIDIALDMFKEAGVETEWFEGDLGGPKILFNGKWFQP